MIYPPSQKPPIWSIDPGAIAYNCQRAEMPNPVLAMPMWEGAGNLARDYSGRGNHGTFSFDPLWSGEGIYFSPAELKLLTFSSTVQSYTFIFRVKSLSGGTFKYLFDSAAGRFVIGWAGSSDGNLGIYDNSAWRVFGATPNDGAYHNVIFTLDNSASESKCYVDGVQNGSTQGYVGVNIGGATEIVSDAGFVGTISNCIICESVLTAAQVKFISYNPWFMYQIPEELYGYVGAPPTGNPFWYYNMLKRRN